MRRSGRLLRHLASAESILARDLFIFNPQVNSLGKIPHVGRKPSFYPRTVTEYLADTAEVVTFGRNNSILETLAHDKDFHQHLQSRTERIQNFLGSSMTLEFQDLLCILCGFLEATIKRAEEQLPKMDSDKGFSQHPFFSTLLVEHDRLRDMGEKFYNLHSICSTVFADLQHLSTSQAELEQSLHCLDDRREIITEFMKNNDLYNCIIPYRGPTAGTVIPQDRYEQLKEQIKDDTCVASFFTLLGITGSRFGARRVLEELWHPRIMGSDTGILKLVTDRITKA